MEFDSIPDIEGGDYPDDVVLTRSISDYRRANKSRAKYSDDRNVPMDEDDGGYFPRKTNGSIAPSVQEEQALRKQHNVPKPRVTMRETFRDDDAEDILDYRLGSSSAIAPAVENVEDMKIAPLRKEKPALKEKKKSGKGTRGEKLTTEHAIEFMIKQRQEMNDDYAALRRENEELRLKMSAQQHITPTKDGGEPAVVEKIVERRVVDPQDARWKEDAQQLRKENEELRALHAEREKTIKQQKELAQEAQQRRLSQLSPVARSAEDQQQLDSDPPRRRSKGLAKKKRGTRSPASSCSDTDGPELLLSGSSRDSETPCTSSEDDNKQQGQRPRKLDQFSSVRTSHPNKKPSRRHGKKSTAPSANPEPADGQRANARSRPVPRLDLSAVPPSNSPPQQVAAPQVPSAVSKQPTDSKHSGLPVLLWKGAILWKIPYNGRGLPERRLVMIKRATQPGPRAKPVQVLSAGASQGLAAPVAYIIYPPTLIWANPDKPDDLSSARELSLYEGAHLVEGHQSPAFWKSKSRGNPLPPEKLCFSIVTSTRSLDLAAESVGEAVAWKSAIHTLLVIISSNKGWAMDKLHRDKPTWYHQQLEKPPEGYSRKKTEEPQRAPSPVQQDVDPRGDAAYRAASAAARTAPNLSLKDQMFRAAREGNYELLHNILKTKISVNLMETENNDTPMMIACRAGFDDITKLCLHFGAKNDPHPDFGQTALHCAVEGRAHKCAKVILEAAAPSQSNVVIVNLRDANEKTPLHIAAAFGDTKMCRLLLSHGSALNNRDNNQKTPLHLCACNGHKICLSFLLDHEGDSYLDMPDVHGNTALHYAAENGQYACAKLLLETAANPIARNNRGQTPYNLANGRGHQPICQLLLEYNDPDIMQRGHSLSLDAGYGAANRLERNISFPQPGSPYPGGLDAMGLPRPHTASRSISAGMAIPGPAVPMQQSFVGLHPSHLMYVDPALLHHPMTARAASADSAPMVGSQVGGFGNLTARERPSTLFQGLQLNNPLTSRPNIAVDTRLRAISCEHSTSQMGSHSYSPIVTQSFFGSRNAGENSSAPAPQQHEQSLEQHTDKGVLVSERDITHPLEEFELSGTQWTVYETEEGYRYYLDSATEHSQWEDPRTHGLLRYDEATGEYVAEEIPSNSDIYRQETSEDRSGGRKAGRGDVRYGDDLPLLDSVYRETAPGGDKRGSQVRGKGSRPRRIKAADVSPDLKDGKAGRYWSGSDDDASMEEIVESRRGGGGARGGRAGSRPRGRQHGLNDMYSDSLEDLHPEDLSDYLPSRRRGEGKSRSSRRVGDEQAVQGRGGFFEIGADEDGWSADDVDSLQFGEDMGSRATAGKRNHLVQGGAFADAEDPQFLLDGPEEASSPVDREGNEGCGGKTNCFSPDKASLERAAQLQRSFSPKALLGSSEGGSGSDSGVGGGSGGRGGKSRKVKGKGKKSLSATPLSDEENIDYSRSGRGGGVQTAYSDEDDGEESAEDGSDWDAESEVDDKAKHTSTGKLGNVETRIRNQSAKKPARLKKPSKLKSPEGIDENQLKKGKIFSGDSVGYGNGGNTFQLPPLEEPKPSSFPTLKAGGSGFVSPRPQVQLDTAEMEARIQPYIDLLRQGTPVLLVKTNMARAGETRETIKMMLERADELHLSSDVDLMRLSTEAPGESRVDTDVNKASKEELAVLKQDPDIGKYIKMHGMGIPTANVFQKMELDQVSEENVKRVKRALGVKLEEEDAGTKDNLRESMRRKASVPLLKMHWNTLPPEKLRNSIFANGKDEDSMQDEEMEELEKLFGAQSKVEPEAVAQVVDKRMRLIVLDAKRAQNVVIGLAQFKAFGSHDALLGAVCGMDEMSGHLNGDRLQNLSQLIPSVPESRRIHGMEGSEHPAELFFLVADKYFPDLPKRLACFITCCTFQEACDGVMAKMKKIIDACNEIISSDNLARVLQKMLTVGNLMNEGTFRGQASGFSLDSLLKMVHTKGVDKKTSVLDYVVKSLLDKADDAVMGVSEDLSFDDETARVSGKDTGREADQLLQGVAELEEAHDAAREGRTQSAVADAFTDSFVAKLEAFLAVHRDRLAEMSKMRILMDKKVAIVVEYFGEDQNVCDTTNIFSVLREFKIAFEHSKKTIISRMERKNRSSGKNFTGETSPRGY